MKLNGLFLNTADKNCSIYESGKMVFDCISDSQDFSIVYKEIDLNDRTIELTYDFYVFNYHPSQMGWLDTKLLNQIAGKIYTLVLEINPNDPFVFVNESDFDGFVVLDPTLKHSSKKAFPFVRPLEQHLQMKKEFVDKPIPVIGSFGFPTPGKGFELLVDAVKKEFDEAIIRINIPPVNEFTSKQTNLLQNMDYAVYLKGLCKEVARDGITLEITNSFLSKEELIRWCSENSLNCFMYSRYKPGLSATTDQAVVSGRPLAISSDYTFRHLHQYIKPYPFRSLKESILQSAKEVEKINGIWTKTNFQESFIKMLKETGCKSVERSNASFELPAIENQQSLPKNSNMLSVLTQIKRILRFIKRTFQVSESISAIRESVLEIPEKNIFRENTILFISHSKLNCGIHEFGLNLKDALKKSERYHFCYAECDNEEQLRNAVVKTNPRLLILNYNEGTLPWLNKEVLKKYLIPSLGYVHEFDQSNLKEKVANELFDFYVFPDPSLDLSYHSNCFKTGRLISPFLNHHDLPLIPTIGSFGFGFRDKGFEKLVTKVQEEFDEAIIRINMPFSYFADPDGTKMVIPVAENCRRLVKKPGIKLEISHDFLDKDGILNFLSQNSINAFFYDVTKNQGISSALDYALSVQRPIAISSAGMFRHLKPVWNKVTIENNTIKEILEGGIVPLVSFYNEWSEASMIMTYENIIDKVLNKPKSFDPVSASFEIVKRDSFNFLLNDSEREVYKGTIQKMFELSPAIMARKIYEANIQQAFVLNTSLHFLTGISNPKILSVGSFEDSAGDCLKKLGYVVEEIDPSINYDLDKYFNLSTTLKGTYDLVFSTSVIEHVQNDSLFINQISRLLKPAGKAVITCDYKPDYIVGDPLPLTDLRFYTLNDLQKRLLESTENCRLIGAPSWHENVIDFFYSGTFNYSFATFVFEKI